MVQQKVPAIEPWLDCHSAKWLAAHWAFHFPSVLENRKVQLKVLESEALSGFHLAETTDTHSAQCSAAWMGATMAQWKAVQNEI